MTHVHIIERYIEIFGRGTFSGWDPCGFRRVRLKYPRGREVVFTYNSPGVWCLESVDSFITNVMLREKMVEN